jgi:hypothetical protein
MEHICPVITWLLVLFAVAEPSPPAAAPVLIVTDS